MLGVGSRDGSGDPGSGNPGSVDSVRSGDLVGIGSVGELGVDRGTRYGRRRWD